MFLVRTSQCTIRTALHFSNVGTPHRLKVKGISFAHFSALVSISFAMSLLNVPCVRFPPLMSSLACSLSRPASSTSFGGSEQTPVLPLTGVECLAAWPIRPQTQVMSPKLPSPRRRHHNLHHRRSRRFSAFRSIQQQQANRSKQSSNNVRILRCEPLKKQWPNSVDSQASIQETGGNVDGRSRSKRGAFRD